MAKIHSSVSDWTYRQQDTIAQNALTNSKRLECLIKGVYPSHFTHGQGCILFDPSGKSYVDFICGLGTNLLGYGNGEIAQVIGYEATRGCSLSLSSPLEVLTAEKIKECMPFIERVKFLKSGSEACTAALIIARAKTGRSEVLTEGYHGFHPEFVSLTPPHLGIPGKSEHLDKLESLEQITHETAAVIVEPVMTEFTEARTQWLRDLRVKCDKTGTLLIFDEIITGFRFPQYCASQHLGIIPDLICLGKAIANGMPLAVVAGSQDVMNCGEYFVSSTYAGERLSLAAAVKTMTLLQTKYKINDLWEQGSRFKEKFNALYPEKLWIEGYPTRGVFKGDKEVKDLFWQEACRAGILLGPSWFFNFHHIDVVDQILSTFKDIMTRIKTGSVEMIGEPSQSPFAQKMREASNVRVQ